MQYLLITGTGRSGTTLIEKLLHNHQQVAIGSQPFPFLYFTAKKEFYARKKLHRRYPLGHLFLERDYTWQDWNAFLEQYELPLSVLEEIFYAMHEYSGQYMPEWLPLWHEIVPGRFYDIYTQALALLAKYFQKDTIIYIGTKETFVEEFIPFFLSKAVKVLLIIRDPRDVVTSLNFGEGSRHGGKIRPLLYILRHWRKSVSFCLKYQTHPYFMWVKYEELVMHPDPVLKNVTRFLGLSPFEDDFFSNAIISSQNGRRWQGNSSFGETSFITRASVANFKTKLSQACIRYIETTCFPEFRILGYELLHTAHVRDENIIQQFTEPFIVNHEKFESDYSSHPDRIHQEVQRLQYLQQDLSLEEQQQWFIFPEAYQQLRAQL